METIFATLTDEQRVSVLNSVYQKGLSTSKENLAFSADLLAYLKPFISTLTNDNGVEQDLCSRLMAREVIDQLLRDIMDEIEVNYTSEDAARQVALEYGLGIFINEHQEIFYYANKVA